MQRFAAPVIFQSNPFYCTVPIFFVFIVVGVQVVGDVSHVATVALPFGMLRPAAPSTHESHLMGQSLKHHSLPLYIKRNNPFFAANRLFRVDSSTVSHVVSQSNNVTSNPEKNMYHTYVSWLFCP